MTFPKSMNTLALVRHANIGQGTGTARVCWESSWSQMEKSVSPFSRVIVHNAAQKCIGVLLYETMPMSETKRQGIMCDSGWPVPRKTQQSTKYLRPIADLRTLQNRHVKSPLFFPHQRTFDQFDFKSSCVKPEEFGSAHHHFFIAHMAKIDVETSSDQDAGPVALTRTKCQPQP